MFFLEKSREFWKILEKSRKFRKILQNLRKIPEILGNPPGDLEKSRQIARFLCRELAQKLIPHWFCWFHRNSIDFQRPTFQFSGSKKCAQNGFSWPRSGINLSINGMRKLVARSSSRALSKDTLQHCAICAFFSASLHTKSWWKWCPKPRRQAYILSIEKVCALLGPLWGPIETPAGLSLNQEPETWDLRPGNLGTWELIPWCLLLLERRPELKRLEKIEKYSKKIWNDEIGTLERSPSRYGENFFWGEPYPTVIKSDFWVIFPCR